MLMAVSTYISALNGQWTAFVDIATLLQVESLKELSLKLRDEPAVLPGAANPNDEGVSSMMAQLLAPPRKFTPVSAHEPVSGTEQDRPKKIRQADLAIPDEDGPQQE